MCMEMFQFMIHKQQKGEKETSRSDVSLCSNAICCAKLFLPEIFFATLTT